MNSLEHIKLLTINNQPLSLKDLVVYLKINEEWNRLTTLMTERILLKLEKEKKDISIGDVELQNAFDQLRKKLKLLKKDDIKLFLEQTGLTLLDLQNEAEIQVIKSKILNQLASQESIQKYFNENKPNFDSVSLSMILVDDEGVAFELMAQLQEMEIDFASAALKYSKDYTTKEKGGFLGQVRRGMFDSEIEAKLFGARAGEILGPYQMKKNYYLFQVAEVQKAALTPSIHREIANLLYNEWLKLEFKNLSVEKGDI